MHWRYVTVDRHSALGITGSSGYRDGLQIQLVVLLLGRRTARLQHLFGELELDARLAFSVRQRRVRQQGRMTHDGRAGVAHLMRDPLAVAVKNTAEERKDDTVSS